MLVTMVPLHFAHCFPPPVTNRLLRFRGKDKVRLVPPTPICKVPSTPPPNGRPLLLPTSPLSGAVLDSNLSSNGGPLEGFPDGYPDDVVDPTGIHCE